MLAAMLKQDSVASGKSGRVERPSPRPSGKGSSWVHIKVELR